LTIIPKILTFKAVKANFKKLPIYLSLFTLLLFLAALPIIVQETQKPKTVPTRAEMPVVGGTLSLFPASDRLTINQETDLQILLSTGSYQAAGVDVRLNYDPNTIEVISLSEGSIPEITLYPAKSVDAATGQIIFSGVISTEAIPFSGDNLLLGTIRVKPIALTGSTALNFEFVGPLSADPFDLDRRNDSNLAEFSNQLNDILEQVSNGTYQVVPPPTSTPTPTPTSTPIPTATPLPLPITLNLKIELEGRSLTDTSRARLVTIKIFNTTFTTTAALDDLGQIAGLLLDNLLPGSYELLIKPDGYLQKQFAVNLVAGQNDLDFSTNFEFIAGDFDNSGEINSIDYSVIIANWNTAAADADIDGSGRVNSLDASLIIANWRLHGDQEGI